MGLLRLNWTPVITANVLSQRASKRIKSVGGAWSTLGFIPADDMSIVEATTVATVNDNTVYEFKLENICTTGGPTTSLQGILENIAFNCIAPALSATETTVNVDTNLAGTDITKVKYTLRKASDNSSVGAVVVVRSGNAAPTIFSGLDTNTAYYVTLELYATINGIDAISSNAAYMNAVCGGNIGGYTISTFTHVPEFKVTSSQFTSLITNLTGVSGFTFNVGAPVAGGGVQTGTHNAFTGVIIVTITGALALNPGNLTLTVDGVIVECIAVVAPGTFSFASHSFPADKDIQVSFNGGTC